MALALSNNPIKTINFLLYRFRYLTNYIIIGFLSIVLEMILIQILAPFSMDIILKRVGGFLAGMFFSFVLNSQLNFKVPKSKNARTFFIFLTISTVAFTLNILIIKILGDLLPLSYNYLRIFTAAMVFMISYTAHRKITFNFVKNVGVAVYLNSKNSISEAYSKVRDYADFIHIDLVDKTIDRDAKEIDLSLMREINKTWMLDKIMHIMSKKPSIWIEKLHNNVDVILFHIDIEEPITNIIKLCRKYEKRMGLVVGPDSDLDLITDYLNDVEFVQLMGISNIGKSGQLFNPKSLQKLKELNRLKDRYGFEVIFDGGVKPTNIGRINARYIVSSSGLLTSKDPIRALMELKTSSRYNYSISEQIRMDILKSIKKATDLDFIKSVNLVGSFAEGKNLVGISDIDIVIIIDEFSKNKFQKILEKFYIEKNDLQSKYGFEVYINNFLGPLKFDSSDKIVFHVMIYDIKSHKDHCEKSPFTCYDWQRTKTFSKKHMSEISKVFILQPSYFFNSRRSAKEYLSEIKENKLSYREYIFEGDRVIEKRRLKEMSVKDRIEFAYHIMRFLMLNFIKLYNRKNKKIPNDSLIKDYFNIFPKNKKRHASFVNDIFNLKNEKTLRDYPHLNKKLEDFISDFESQFKDYFYNNSKKVYFLRHGKTALNKPGRFIGQLSNPEIIGLSKKDILYAKANIDQNIEYFFSSPLKRCVSTIESIFQNQKIMIDDNLKEINYGLAEKKDFVFLSEKYPEIINGWNYGEDMRFPEGENSRDVLERTFKFIKKLEEYPAKNIVVCTHNVFLRSLIGHSLQIPIRDWYKIDIPYNKPLKFLITEDKRIYIDLSDSLIKEVLKNF